MGILDKLSKGLDSASQKAETTIKEAGQAAVKVSKEVKEKSSQFKQKVKKEEVLRTDNKERIHYCSKCGKKNNSKALFCSGCGHKF